MGRNFTRSLKEENSEIWDAILNHPFFRELGSFQLPKEKFKVFMEQDYQYLLGFIRSLGLLLAKSEEIKDIMEIEELIGINLKEIELHEGNYESLGCSKKDLRRSEPSLTTKSYISYLLSQGYGGTAFETLGVFLPCDWIFADVGKKLIEDAPEPSKELHRKYIRWIKKYASDEYRESVQDIRRKVDEKSKYAGESEKGKFRKNFTTGLKFEHAFLESVHY